MPTKTLLSQSAVDFTTGTAGSAATQAIMDGKVDPERMIAEGIAAVIMGATGRELGGSSAGEGELFGKYASKAAPIDGYTDVIIHGAPPNKVGVMHNGEWVYLDQRSLANFLRQDAGYTGGAIRLLSCGTGSSPTGFAQNLANKMGVEVMAPSDTIWAFPNGRLTIGPDSFTNTGHWNIFLPGKH